MRGKVEERSSRGEASLPHAPPLPNNPNAPFGRGRRKRTKDGTKGEREDWVTFPRRNSPGGMGRMQGSETWPKGTRGIQLSCNPCCAPGCAWLLCCCCWGCWWGMSSSWESSRWARACACERRSQYLPPMATQRAVRPMHASARTSSGVGMRRSSTNPVPAGTPAGRETGWRAHELVPVQLRVGRVRHSSLRRLAAFQRGTGFEGGKKGRGGDRKEESVELGT